MWFNHGLHLEKEGKREEALKAFNRTVQIWPDYAEAWCKIGALSLDRGEYPEAIKAAEELERLSEFRDTKDIRAILGLIWEETGNIQKAKIIFQKNLAEDPSHYDSLMFLGMIYMMEHNYKRAAELYEKAALLYSNDAVFQNIFLSSLIELKDHKKAREQFDKMQHMKIPVAPELTKKLGIR